MARPFRNRGNGYLIISINYTIIIYNLSKGKMEGWKRFFALWTFGYIQFMKREFLLLFVDDSISCSFIFSARNEMPSFLEAVDKIVSILERWIFNICNVLFISIFQNISFSSSDLLSLPCCQQCFNIFQKFSTKPSLPILFHFILTHEIDFLSYERCHITIFLFKNFPPF